ncbi:MAG TPA: DUF4387 domain-containing protein [bacterium]|nr:DUF4387 domain-containing protein [bacterium]
MIKVEKLYQKADVFRSKNAGPFLITVDIMFETREKFDGAVKSGVINKKVVSERYMVAEDKVNIFLFPPALAVKIVFPRNVSSGAPGDRDVYGAQQAGCLEDL